MVQSRLRRSKADFAGVAIAGAPTNGSAWVSPVGTQRVYRGGGYYANASYARAGDRGAMNPTSREDDIGFRLAR